MRCEIDSGLIRYLREINWGFGFNYLLLASRVAGLPFAITMGVMGGVATLGVLETGKLASFDVCESDLRYIN